MNKHEDAVWANNHIEGWKGPTLLSLLALARYSDEGGEVRDATSLLRGRTGISQKSAYRHLRRLREGGAITKLGADHYRVEAGQ